jgi:hypothetical protein
VDITIKLNLNQANALAGLASRRIAQIERDLLKDSNGERPLADTQRDELTRDLDDLRAFVNGTK